MKGTGVSEREARAAREVTARAIRRLDLLQALLLVGTGVLAVGGGALIAWLLAARAGLPFRATWIATSVVIFVVSGGISLVRMARAHRAAARRSEPDEPRPGASNTGS